VSFDDADASSDLEVLSDFSGDAAATEASSNLAIVAAAAAATQTKTSTKPKRSKPTANAFRGKQDKTTAEMARESRNVDTQKLREINREKKLAAIRSKPVPPAAAAMPPAVDSTPPAAPPAVPLASDAIIAHFPSGEPCTKAQFDLIISEWAKKNNMPIEESEKHLAKEFKDNAQDFVNAFASLLSDKSEAWREQEQSISYMETVDGWENYDDDIDKLLNDG